jgi:hypothetical protein
MQRVDTRVGRDEAIAVLEAHGSANERAIDVDDIRLLHDKNIPEIGRTFRRGRERSDIAARPRRSLRSASGRSVLAVLAPGQPLKRVPLSDAVCRWRVAATTEKYFHENARYALKKDYFSL